MTDLNFLKQLPDDPDGYHRWYWSIGSTPLGYRASAWHGSHAKWTYPDDGLIFEAEGETLTQTLKKLRHQLEKHHQPKGRRP